MADMGNGYASAASTNLRHQPYHHAARFASVALVACLYACAAEEPVKVSPVIVDAFPEAPDCAPLIKAAVRKYLPLAMGYPANSVRRIAYLDLMYAKEHSALALQSPFMRGVCEELTHRLIDAETVDLENRGLIR